MHGKVVEEDTVSWVEKAEFGDQLYFSFRLLQKTIKGEAGPTFSTSWDEKGRAVEAEVQHWQLLILCSGAWFLHTILLS